MVAIPSVEHIMKTTAFKRRSLAESALETYHWLADGAPHKFNGFSKPVEFNMAVGLQGFNKEDEDIHDVYDDEKNVCKTVCCIAGSIYFHNQKINKKKVDYKKFSIEEYFEMKKYESRYGYWCDYKVDKELNELFFPENGYNGKGPKKAARVLLHYLKTGKTNWSL